AAASLFSVSDPDGDPITMYQFVDQTGDPSAAGRLVVNGAAQATWTGINLTPQDLADTVFQPGSGGTTSLFLRAYDGIAWGAYTHFLVTSAMDHAPVITAANQQVAGRAPVAASSLF